MPPGTEPMRLRRRPLDGMPTRHHPAGMTTTITLEPDLARSVEALAHRRGMSFEQALNELIRLGLNSPARQDAQPKFTVQPHPSGFRPGIDPGKLNQLFDQLEVEDFHREGTAVSLQR
jgi:hypothetical protein